jgi:PucR family transcriptional regulator, purine catabolism regulatory protein
MWTSDDRVVPALASPANLSGAGRVGTVTSGTPRPGPPAAQPLADVLAAPVLAGARVLAGSAGLHRRVERLNVMEVPDILPWVKPHEFLLTTAYPLRGRPDSLPALIEELDDAGLAGVGIKLGRYLDELPPAVLERAEARAFPVVQLPDGVGFDEILNEVLTGILHRQAQALERSQRIHRLFLQLVLRGQGLPEIAAALAELLDAPVAIVDRRGRVLAASGIEALGLAVGAQLDVEPASGTARAGDRRLACLAVPISAGARDHGHVVALADRESPTDDLPALEHAATVAALTITKQMEVQAVEDKYRSDLMYDLLREVDDRDDVLRRATSFGWDLDRPLVTLVLRVDDPPAPVVPDEVTRRPPLAAAVRRLVTERDPGAAVVRFSNEVVVLTTPFEGPEARCAARAFAARLADEAGRSAGGTVSVGLARPVADVRLVATGYEQARRAVTIGRRVHGDGAIAHFDELGVHRLLSLVEDPAELRAFVAATLGSLAGDDPTAADLRRTLQALIDAGGNVAEAARRLHYHYNTLRYRIDKLESILGPFTTDARLRLDVQLALLVHDLRGLDEA